MLHKTRGIVLKCTDYSNSSVIAQVFTEKFGLQSYMVNGVRKARSRVSSNVLQPLHLLEMVVYHKNTVSVQRVKDIRNQPAFLSIPLDIGKSTVCLFLCEVLYKVLRRHSGEDPALFGYIFSSLEWLDNHEGAIANFHLFFLMGLTRYLGFYPDTRLPRGRYFDLQQGQFGDTEPPHGYYLRPALALPWKQLCEGGYSALPALQLSGEERQHLLTGILEYYALHIEDFGQLRSYEILQELFS